MIAGLSGITTKVTFEGGTEHGKTRDVWATREIVVVVQSPAAASADEIQKTDLKVLMSKQCPKPRRQIYEHAGEFGESTIYRLARVETP